MGVSQPKHLKTSRRTIGRNDCKASGHVCRTSSASGHLSPVMLAAGLVLVLMNDSPALSRCELPKLAELVFRVLPPLLWGTPLRISGEL
jgi:hypothetical protein